EDSCTSIQTKQNRENEQGIKSKSRANA
ncbi:hypothetical protein CCACVL1_06902, partial [Corchorus capsularis]